MTGVKVTEAAFQRRITDLCSLLGLRWFHSGDSRRDSAAGYPDLTIIGPAGVLFAELKTDTGRATPEQQQWLAAINAAGSEAHLWRPGDWDAAAHRLHQLAGRRP